MSLEPQKMSSVSLGWRPNAPFTPNSLQSLLSQAQNCGYNFVCVPIKADADHKLTSLDDLDGLIQWQKSLIASSDRSLFDSNDWSNRVLFHLSSRDIDIIEYLLDYAAHLTVFAVLIDLDWSKEMIFKILALDEKKNFSFKIYISCDSKDWGKLLDLKCVLFSTKIRVVPVISTPSEQPLLQMWKCENVEAIIIKSDAFIANRQGYPVLPLILQKALLDFRKALDFDFPVIVWSDEPEDYSKYLRWFFDPDREANKLSLEEERMRCFAEGFNNILQTPLKPASDNITSETYEVFEMDPVKYKLYQDAIEAALNDLLEISSSESLKIGIFGAGRGPLVQCTLDALEKLSYKGAEILVIEKSPNACLTLLDRFRAVPNIKIIYQDMRVPLKIPKESLDLVVSELLGSFGDNELAPECLKPVECLLKPKRGIMIPQEYISYIQPCYAPILSSKVRELSNLVTGNPFDYHYVVRVTRAHFPSSPESVFSFQHPSESNSSSSFYRETEILFKIAPDALIDGFVGYFECKLYDKIFLSTLPGNAHSPGMLSWFPIYFPLEKPIKSFTHPNHIEFLIKRRVLNQRIWYEWSVKENGQYLYIQNEDGRSHLLLDSE